ncbi:MAG: HIT family protein [Candidatus Liptonbacteria bacterium]|nr:HIT family protein [Candidatus Liptonbacteria bacterium]
MADCVFCDRTKFEERLVGETADFWVMATLGQITDGGYLLLVPKKHVKCMGELTNDEARRMFELYPKIEHSSYNWPHMTAFEHGIVGQTIEHAHIHFIPARFSLTPRIRTDFPKVEFQELVFDYQLQLLYRKRKEPYLLWTDRDSDNHIVWQMCWNPPAPPQYLRIVVAEALGRPERANWRNMDHELDQRLCSETVRRLTPYFKKA